MAAILKEEVLPFAWVWSHEKIETCFGGEHVSGGVRQGWGSGWVARTSSHASRRALCLGWRGQRLLLCNPFLIIFFLIIKVVCAYC